MTVLPQTEGQPWRVKLDCGHFSVKLSYHQMEAAWNVGISKCHVPACGGVHHVVDGVKFRTMTAGQSALVLERRQASEVGLTVDEIET